MRAHSLLNTLTCSAASAAIATWLATFGSDVPKQSLEQRGLHIALAAYLGCLVVFMLTQVMPMAIMAELLLQIVAGLHAEEVFMNHSLTYG